MENNWFIDNLPVEYAARAYDGRYNIWQFRPIDRNNSWAWVVLNVVDSVSEAEEYIKKIT